MQKRDSTFRRQVFKEELHTLKEEKYIDELNFNKMETAYNLYLQDLDERKHEKEVVVPKQIVKEQPKSIKPKNTLTPEKIRERNISWSLILGVILLFIGGLVFGTSNWHSMNNVLKVLFVSLVSIVFFGSSYIAEKYLHIHKTAFAFLTLGSLFLPITFLSIGFFELLGTWLSLYGGGRYVFGFVSSGICLLLYTFIATKYKHRLFVWFSYLAATIGVSFLLAYLPRDFFYLGMMLYNALLLFCYYKLKDNQSFALFTKELFLFAQINLILSTLLMLFIFENATFYSFNLLLTAVLYLSMVFVNKARHYHYIFTFLFVYGMYQLIQNSFLSSIDYIGFALIGILYLIFQQYANKEAYIQRVFQVTSGIISCFAFIFISIQGLLLRSDGDSIVLFFAYLIIAINYIWLSNIAKQQIFRYLAPIFLMAACFQSYFVLFKVQNYGSLYMFTMATIMYVVFYLKNHFKYFTAIKTSSFIISIGTMVLSIFFASGTLTHSIILFFAFGCIALLTYHHTKNKNLKKITTWVNPISWGLSLISFFEYAERHIVNNIGSMGLFAISGLLLLAISYVWKSRKQLDLDNSTFLTATAIYTLSIVMSPLELYNHPFITSCIYLGGIAIYILLVYKMKKDALWTFVSITSVFFLSSLTVTLKLENTLYTLYVLLIPILLLLVYEYVGRKIQELKPYFFWTAHVYLIGAFLFTVFLIIFKHLHPALLFMALGAYIYSTLKQKNEQEIKLFLYASFTTLPIIIYLMLIYYNLDNLITSEYLFPIVTGIIALLWLSVNETWKKRIDWYLIPQTIVGLLIGIPFIMDIFHFGLFISYTILTLYVLHKRNWRIFTIIPLLIATIFLVRYLFFIEKPLQIGLVVVAFFALHQFGKFAYKQLANRSQIDWYTMTSWIYIIILVVIISDEDPLWFKLIPSLLIVYSLYTLINRFTSTLEKRIIKTITAISLLLPYYIILKEFDVNQYIRTELYTLPFIGLTIFLSRHTWKDYKKQMNTIQSIVLLIVTYILVTDALKSNTIYDALIIGVLSLASMLGGMHYRMKSYFFVGIGVLLLNVLLQTRPYWGNFPWWGYLIIAGLTLIGFASFYELQKQKKNTDKKSFLQTKKEQIITRFKDWD
ncbi:SCO7613 C-terminal domain-containing membrane protein [Ectobacillus polymachus]|uniref:SCO7613 C-terminal domain-containing membrane protein n=1 Tax=Ectobacillus polymachus TaxID=1508806 RepID=UPI003A8BE322